MLVRSQLHLWTIDLLIKFIHINQDLQQYFFQSLSKKVYITIQSLSLSDVQFFCNWMFVAVFIISCFEWLSHLNIVNATKPQLSPCLSSQPPLRACSACRSVCVRVILREKQMKSDRESVRVSTAIPVESQCAACSITTSITGGLNIYIMLSRGR